ncbi:MAG: D-alanyl-D-alanine carboxypeptidase [Cryobacterium sp.]
MPLTRRQIYRRRRIAFFGAFVVLVGSVGYLAATGLAPVPAAAATLTQPESLTQPTAAPDWPGFGASAIGAVGFPGVLGSSGSTESVPIASVTKTVTALVVLDAKPLTGTDAGPDITFTDTDVDIYYDVIADNGSVAPVVAGMVLSEREALQAMMLPSANNYAMSLAVWAFGSHDAYLAAAKDWLARNGLDDTTVADTSGLSTGSRSSTADLIDIGKLALNDPALASIVSMPSVTLPVIGTVKNTNKLLGRFGIDGIKTGTTDAAGACLLFSTDVKVGSRTVTLVGVVLGGNNHSDVNSAVAALIASAKAGFHEVTLTDKGAAYGTYATAWGESSRAVAAKAASALVWSDTPVSGVANVRELGLGAANDKVGSVEFTVGDQTVSVPLVLDRAVSDPGLAWRFSHPGELSAGH